jgi:hypothetical protein
MEACMNKFIGFIKPIEGFMKGHLKIDFRAESAGIYSESSEKKNQQSL